MRPPADAVRRLADAGVASPELDARVLVEHAASTGQELEELIAKRVARVPLQHLTGVAHFRYLTLQVGPGVFVPRPETEVLAGWVIERARELDSAVVVDLCAGSGAIALAVATEVPSARVYAVELGEDAVEWARLNLAGSGVDLRHGDMADAFRDLEKAVDIVVGNPPYIPLEAYESVEPEVRDHDPGLALWSGGGDGLDAMRIVEVTAARLLRPGGHVGAEHADVQGESAPAVFSASGRWADVRDHVDLAGRPRFVTARLAR